jgi:hypothetical protein
MHARDYHHNVIIDPIDNSIRKPANQRATCVTMNHWMPEGMRTDILEGGMNSRQEFIA